MLLRWSSFIALDLFWGNGESVIKLLRSLAIITIMVALGDVFFLRDLYIISNYESAILQAPEILLGITAPNRFSGFDIGSYRQRSLHNVCLFGINIGLKE